MHAPKTIAGRADERAANVLVATWLSCQIKLWTSNDKYTFLFVDYLNLMGHIPVLRLHPSSMFETHTDAVHTTTVTLRKNA